MCLYRMVRLTVQHVLFIVLGEGSIRACTALRCLELLIFRRTFLDQVDSTRMLDRFRIASSAPIGVASLI